MIGIQDTPDDIKTWRGEIQHELGELGSTPTVDDLEICSMTWFVITDAETDQTPNAKLSNLMVGTAGQITDNLKRYREAGLTMPLLWPPFATLRCRRRSTTSSSCRMRSCRRSTRCSGSTQAPGIGPSTRSRWVSSGLLQRLGPGSYMFLGTPVKWITEVAAAEAEFDSAGVVGGCAASRLLGLDGFDTAPVGIIVEREHRRRRCSGIVRSTGRPFQPA